jgi:hypothetical protein
MAAITVGGGPSGITDSRAQNSLPSNNSLEERPTLGIRVEPPISTTSVMSACPARVMAPLDIPSTSGRGPRRGRPSAKAREMEERRSTFRVLLRSGNVHAERH